MPSTPEPSLEAPADPLPAPAASGDGAKAEPEEGSEPAEVTESIPAPEDFVRVADWIPDIYTDLRYAADNNFTGQAIYDFSDAYLRYGTVQKLAAVQEAVAGYKKQCLVSLENYRLKAKELLAYLVDRKGAGVTMGELSAVLWEEGPDTLSRQSNLRNLISDLRKTLCDVGAEGILLKTRNTIAIDADAVDCDYYDFLRHIPYAVNRYQGEYMSQYSWAELTAASIVSG